MAATQIENGLFRENHRGNILIAFHNRGEYLHTLSAGLLAVDERWRDCRREPSRASLVAWIADFSRPSLRRYFSGEI